MSQEIAEVINRHMEKIEAEIRTINDRLAKIEAALSPKKLTSEAQAKFIKKLCADLGIPLPPNLYELSRQEASGKIEELLKRR